LKYLSCIHKIIKTSKGHSTVLLAIMFTIIAGFAALAIDIGSVVIEKSRLSAALDSAALAGVQELMANKDNTRNIVEGYINENTGSVENLEVNVDLAAKSVEVKASRTVNFYLARFLGRDSQSIYAEAKAKAENIKSLKGTRPLAVIKQEFHYGQQYTLKEGAGGGTSGNYAAIAMGGVGGSDYRNNFLYGYSGTITVGDLIETETGNKAGATEESVNYLIGRCEHTPPCTYNRYNPDCSRILFIPVVNTLDVNGRKYVKVLGFATFFLEGASKSNGQADVTGRFISYNAQGQTSSDIDDFGTYGIRLIK